MWWSGWLNTHTHIYVYKVHKNTKTVFKWMRILVKRSRGLFAWPPLSYCKSPSTCHMKYTVITVADVPLNSSQCDTVGFRFDDKGSFLLSGWLAINWTSWKDEILVAYKLLRSLKADVASGRGVTMAYIQWILEVFTGPQPWIWSKADPSKTTQTWCA